MSDGCSYEDWVDGMDEYEPECCPHCGKEYEEFSDLGCGYCGQRSPEWGAYERRTKNT